MKNQEMERVILKLKADLYTTRQLVKEADGRIKDYFFLGLEVPDEETIHYNRLKALEKDILDDLYEAYEVRNGFSAKPVPTSILSY